MFSLESPRVFLERTSAVAVFVQHCFSRLERSGTIRTKPYFESVENPTYPLFPFLILEILPQNQSPYPAKTPLQEQILHIMTISARTMIQTRI